MATTSTKAAKSAEVQKASIPAQRATAQPSSSHAEFLANTMLQVVAAQRNAAHDQLVMKEVELMQARGQIIALQTQIEALERLAAPNQ